MSFMDGYFEERDRLVGIYGDLAYEACKIDLEMQDYIVASPILETLKKDPKMFVEIFMSYGRYLYPAKEFFWRSGWLLSATYYPKNSTPQFRCPELKDLIETYINLTGEDPYFPVLKTEHEDGTITTEKLLTDNIAGLRSIRDDDVIYDVSKVFCEMFVFAFKGGCYYTGYEGLYGFIRHMKHAFAHVNRKVAYMMWAHALCTTYWNDDAEMGTKEEVMKRYHLLLNPKTRCLKKTREFLYYDCFPEKDADGNYIPQKLHAMY